MRINYYFFCLVLNKKMQQVQNYKTINADLITFEKDSRRQITYNLKYGNTNGLFVKASKLTCTTQIFRIDDELFVEVEVPSDLLNIISKTDKKIIKFIADTCEISEIKAEQLYRYPVNLNKRLLLKLLPNNETKVYDDKQNLVDTSQKHPYEMLINPGEQILAVISLDKIRLNKQIAKVSWKINQLRLKKKISDCILSDSDDDSDVENNSDSD